MCKLRLLLTNFDSWDVMDSHWDLVGSNWDFVTSLDAKAVSCRYLHLPSNWTSHCTSLQMVIRSSLQKDMISTRFSMRDGSVV